MTKGITRRTILAASAVPAAASLAGLSAAHAQSTSRSEAGGESGAIRADVVICGGGLSGMTAAWRLAQAGKCVAVLEASDRLGGRTFTRRASDGAAFDLGAQYVGPSQTRVLKLAAELGIAVFKGYGPGDGLLDYQGKRFRLPDGAFALDEADLEEFGRVTAAINALAAQVPLDAPQKAPEAKAWDAMTMRTWIGENVRAPLVAAFVELAVTALLGASPDEISVLFFAYYVRHGDSFEMLISTRDGAQDSRFVGGAQQFSQRLAKRLPAGSVHLQSPVSKIVQTASGVEVSAGEISIAADQVIVAMPPGAADRIVFDPPLPTARRELQARSPMGRYMKIIASYDRAFWKDAGLNGEALNLSGYLFGVFDESEPAAGSHALLGFAAADKLIELRALSPAERRARILAEFASFFGEAALTPTAYLEYDWDDDHWVGGGPVICPPPGTLSRVGAALREPVGRIHWAGTEAAPKWTGYLDGAVRAGEAAAKTVIARSGSAAAQASYSRGEKS
ncbi:MAG: FAD-dependent oxidoreductase [Parasphingorhabdus sp.]|nr:FAD-dependent oxidoreductase [Parasphingorhabdus sp.]